MNRKLAMLAATALLLAAASAQAAEETGKSGAKKAANLSCEDKAATLELTGDAKTKYLEKCKSPLSEAERKAGPQREGKLQRD